MHFVLLVVASAAAQAASPLRAASVCGHFDSDSLGVAIDVVGAVPFGIELGEFTR